MPLHPAPLTIPSGVAHARLPVRVCSTAKEVAAEVAEEIARVIRSRDTHKSPCVLILPTGKSPLGVYSLLREKYVAGEISFAHVHTFNLDEYHGLGSDDPRSYHRFMWENFFSHIDIPRDQVHLPDGTLPRESIPLAATRYEEDIARLGGADLALLGIGRNGHIAFNEPGSPRSSRTRLIALARTTRRDAAHDFGGVDQVPTHGVSMGIASIMDARRIVLMANGHPKAPAVLRCVEETPAESCPASFLQDHPNCSLVVDQPAASGLTAVRHPWLMGPVAWDPRMVHRAVISLALTTRKAVLKLVELDYVEHGLHDLIASRGPVHHLNLDVFRSLHASISGWPGGKPGHLKMPGDIDRLRDEVFPKRILVLSPHPDDDVISMGGTLMRLIEQGHMVYVAYMVSGHNGVSDVHVERLVQWAAGAAQALTVPEHLTEAYQGNDPTVRRLLRAQVRRSEAIAALSECGLDPARVTFLDLPFYDRRTSQADPVGEDDVDAVAKLVEKFQPHQVYAAGDLTDPNGTHRRCLEIISKSLAKVAWNEYDLWLYRGAWETWEPHRISLAVPLSPPEVSRKRLAILHHQSQRDHVLFPGDDPREFWQRAEDRSRDNARILDALGLAEYEAVETFATWDGSLSW